VALLLVVLGASLARATATATRADILFSGDTHVVYVDGVLYVPAVAPTDTDTPEATQPATSTAIATDTATAAATSTSVASTPSATNTAGSSVTNTRIATNTRAATNTRPPTNTRTVTLTRTVTSTPAPVQTSIVYDDAFRGGWSPLPWDTNVIEQDPSYAHSGQYSVSALYNSGGAGFQMDHLSFNDAGYAYLDFWVMGGSYPGTWDVGVWMEDASGHQLHASQGLDAYLPAGHITQEWQEASIPLADLGALNKHIGEMVVQDGADPPPGYPLFFDDISFTVHPRYTPTPTATGTPPTATITRTPTQTLTVAPTLTPATQLTAIPAGFPSTMGVGLFNNPPISNEPSGVPWTYRYAYLAGGVNTGEGWQNYGTNWAQNYVADTRAHGQIPGFVYYNILQSLPANDEYGNLQNASTMLSYYQDFKALLQQMNDGQPAFIAVEPDLDGVMMQNGTNHNDDASGQPAKVASTGMSELQGLPDNFRGYWQALVRLRDQYAPAVVLGQDLSLWGTGDDLIVSLRNDPNYDWRSNADRVARYHNSFGPGYELNFFSPRDRDAAYYLSAYGSNRWWWDDNSREPRFSTMAAWLSRIDMAMGGKRALLWQVPNGNRVERAENNTDGHYQDDFAEYWLNPTSGRSNMGAWANSGVIGIMFGAGAGGQSHYFDAAGDGVTNPAPLATPGNPMGVVNNQTSTVSDDDGGYIRVYGGQYYAQGPVPLP
jgi:hypothetical protein